MRKLSKYDEYMNRFHIKRNGTLLDVYRRETHNLGQSGTDTDKRLKIRVEILKKYYADIKSQDDFDEEEYNILLSECEDFVTAAETQQ